MSKVLLIEPPSPKDFTSLRVLGSIGSTKADMVWPPYDLMLIGGLLRKHDIYDFKIIDANNLKITFSKLKDIIKRESPEIIVFTITNHSLVNDLLTAKVAKDVSKNIVTVAIGLSIRAIRDLNKVLKKYSYLDIIVYNEAEMPVLNLIKSNYNPRNILGVYYKNDGKVIKNKPQPPENYDELGIPAQDKIPLHIYKDPLMKRSPLTLICASRGCVGSCKYCSSFPFQRPVRYRSIENVMEELRLIKTLGVKEIKFFDSCFTNDLNWVEKFLKRMIKERLDFTWICDVRADRIPLKILKLMKKAGCHTICMGGDSADQKVLDSFDKGETIKQIENAVKRIKKEGFRLLLYFTFGHPGETKETIKKTIKWARKLNPDFATFGVITPVYGTEFYDYLEKNGFLDLNAKRKDFDTIKPPVYNYPWLSSEEIYEMSLKAYREFYLRPSFIFKRLIASPSLKYDLNNFILFIKRYLLSSSTKN